MDDQRQQDEFQRIAMYEDIGRARWILRQYETGATFYRNEIEDKRYQIGRLAGGTGMTHTIGAGAPMSTRLDTPAPPVIPAVLAQWRAWRAETLSAVDDLVADGLPAPLGVNMQHGRFDILNVTLDDHEAALTWCGHFGCPVEVSAAGTHSGTSIRWRGWRMQISSWAVPHGS